MVANLVPKLCKSFEWFLETSINKAFSPESQLKVSYLIEGSQTLSLETNQTKNSEVNLLKRTKHTFKNTLE